MFSFNSIHHFKLLCDVYVCVCTHTQVGWEVKNVVKCLKASGHSVSLTLRVSKPKMVSMLSKKDLTQQRKSSSDSSTPPPIPHARLPLKPLPLERTSSTPTIFSRRTPHPIPPVSPLASPVNSPSPRSSSKEGDSERKFSNGWPHPHTAGNTNHSPVS